MQRGIVELVRRAERKKIEEDFEKQKDISEDSDDDKLLKNLVPEGGR